MSMLWYIALALLFLGVVIVAMPQEDNHTPPPDPRGVMLQLRDK